MSDAWTRASWWLRRFIDKVRPGRLTFDDPALEQAYLASELEPAIARFRRADVLGASFFAAFTYFDLAYFDAPINLVLALIRDGFGLAGFAVALWLSYRPIFRRHHQSVISMVVVYIGITIMAMIYVGHGEILDIYFVGLIVCMIFGYVLLGLRFGPSLVAASCIALLFLCGSLWLFALPKAILQISNVFVVAVLAVGGIASYIHEHQSRSVFRLNQALRLEHDQVTAANQNLEARVSERVAEVMALSAGLEQESVMRQQTELQLQKERDFSATVLDAMSDLVMVFDPELGEPVRWNNTVGLLTGYGEAEIAASHIPEDWYSPEDQQRMREAVQGLELGGSILVNLNLIARDGHTIPLEFAGTLVMSEQQSSPLVIAIGRDITQRRQVEQALRTSGERLELALRSANMGIWEYNWQSEQILFDQRCCDLLHVSSGPLFSAIEELAQGILPEHRAELAQMFRNHLARTQDHFQTEFDYHVEGTGLWIAMSGQVVERDSEGAPTHTVGLIRDVTRARNLQDRLRETAKLEAIGRLAGGVAHDFNNLLTVIIGYGEMSLMGLSPEDELHESLQVILEQGRRAAALTRQLLAFSRREPLRLDSLDLCALIQNLARMLQRLIGEDIRLSLRLANNLPPVRGDGTQLEQVVMNLAVNARDAMPDGGNLAIAAHALNLEYPLQTRWTNLDPGRYVLLDVRDTGEGMSDNVLEHLFEPFYTTKKSGDGTGLGLAVVYSIIDRLNGGLEVESTVGQGTAFRVYLPVSDEPITETQLPQEMPRTGTETILLVEDEDAVRALVRRLLERWGYRVLLAGDGLQALALAEAMSTPADLLLTDVVMPKMTGDALARELRQQWPSLKVLFMTGYNDRLGDERLDRSSRLLIKPLKKEDLVRALRDLLGD